MMTVVMMMMMVVVVMDGWMVMFALTLGSLCVQVILSVPPEILARIPLSWQVQDTSLSMYCQIHHPKRTVVREPIESGKDMLH